METSATATTALAKSTELTKETVLDAIIACAEALDKLNINHRYRYIPAPDWMEELYTKHKADNEALARFKNNSSHWPEQFPWACSSYIKSRLAIYTE